MGSKCNENLNTLHLCDEAQLVFEDYMMPLDDKVYTDYEYRMIYQFFIAQAPILQSAAKSKTCLKLLSDYGWHGTADLIKLEKALCKDSGMNHMIFIKANSITGTLDNMGLKEKGCYKHARAVLKLDYRISVDEKEQVSIKATETRMVCLLRHIRNALAHGRTYVFPEGKIMLEDLDKDNKEITARILMPKEALLKWEKTILKEKWNSTAV